MGGVLRHLFGAGEHGEHRDPRVIAAWALATAGDVAELQPATTATGRRSLRRLVDLLEQPVAAGISPPDRPVWLCSLHNHVVDRLLSDRQWAQIAVEFMAAVGLAPHGDLHAVRWVAVRHGADPPAHRRHLVRQDGRTVWGWNDYAKAQAAARELERRYGLHRVAGRCLAPSRMPAAMDAVEQEPVLGGR